MIGHAQAKLSEAQAKLRNATAKNGEAVDATAKLRRATIAGAMFSAALAKQRFEKQWKKREPPPRGNGMAARNNK